MPNPQKREYWRKSNDQCSYPEAHIVKGLSEENMTEKK